MRRLCHVPLLVAAFILVLNVSPAWSQSSGLEIEARSFMQDYATALRAHDYEALPTFYDRAGTYGSGGLESWESIRASYGEGRWRGPSTFQWDDLSYEVVGSDAVMVSGWFLCGAEPTMQPGRMIYSALLLRRDGEFRIRREHEFPYLEDLSAWTEYCSELVGVGLGGG